MYEYRVWEIGGEHAYDAERISTEINIIAADGWRLVQSIVEGGFTIGLIFERSTEVVGNG